MQRVLFIIWVLFFFVVDVVVISNDTHSGDKNYKIKFSKEQMDRSFSQ